MVMMMVVMMYRISGRSGGGGGPAPLTATSADRRKGLQRAMIPFRFDLTGFRKGRRSGSHPD